MFAEILNKACVKTLKTIVGTMKILMEIMQIWLWKSIPNIKFMEVCAYVNLCVCLCVPVLFHHSCLTEFSFLQGKF